MLMLVYNKIKSLSLAGSLTMMLISVYRVNKAVGARLLVLVDLVDDQEHHTHQEGQGTDHQQGHLMKNRWVYT